MIRTANRALSEAGIDGRFHNVSVVDQNSAITNVGVIFLSSEQRNRLLELKLPRMPWAYDEANVWTSNKVDEIIAGFRELGLLDHLGEEEIAKAREQIAREDLTCAIGLLYEFPNITYSFDTEYFYDLSKIAEWYVKLVTETSQISRGAFEPENIKVVIDDKLEHREGPDIDLYDQDLITLSFVYGGKTYNRKLRYAGEWVDLDFIKMINEALNDAQEIGRFYGVDTGDQSAMIIFLSDEQQKVIQGKNLFELYEF